tara:strand:+ start:9651 stop:10427 length:777 start_codon:yes stop_codon:yes gene_type:complete
MSYRALKHFGQHFLTDKNHLQKIVSAINPQTQQLMVEVGPGMGALTKHIVPLTDHLHVVEIDKRFIELLREQFSPAELTVHAENALKFDFASIIPSEQKIRIIGNLPYNISTPLIFHFLKFKSSIEDMTFLLQKEVVDRMVAKPGNKTYGRLSVMVQYDCQTTPLFDVPPGAFTPPPKVNSAVVHLKPLTRSLTATNYGHFSLVVSLAFQQRRKTIRNSLKSQISAEQLSALSIEPTRRPETLSVDDFVRISNLVNAS